MRNQSEPAPILITLVIFALFMLIESLSYQSHIKPVLYFRTHPDAANKLLSQECPNRQPGDAECLAAWEGLKPMQTPVMYSWAQKLRGAKN